MLVKCKNIGLQEVQCLKVENEKVSANMFMVQEGLDK